MLPPTPRFQVLLAGEGPVKARLEQLVSHYGVAEKVRFLGFREDVAELLAAADMVVLPSLREGLSISLLEAMAAEKPIVATSIGSHLEVASQAPMAELVPPANAQALRDAIVALAGDADRRSALAASGRTLFASRYTEGRMLDEYRELYMELVREKRVSEHSPATSGGQAATSLLGRATADRSEPPIPVQPAKGGPA
jgi:glycosyltransferase involved in cell wall biosynthesis